MMNDRDQLLEEKRLRTAEREGMSISSPPTELMAQHRAYYLATLMNELMEKGFSREEALFLAARSQ